MTVLIVDDNEQNRYQLQVLLRGNGYETVDAANGRDALEIIGRDRPELIISDILMPVMDGFTLCRELKKNEHLSRIPFVFYTATYTDDRDREFALGLGADEFIIKPEDPDIFLRTILDVIGQAREESAALPDSFVPSSEEKEPVYLKQYNEALIRKLEAKMDQVEKANQKLESEIDEHKRAEERVRRLYAMQTVIRNVNQVLLRLRSESDLFGQICSMVTEIPDVTAAWVGLVRYDDHDIKAVAHAGFAEGFVESRKVKWDESVYGRGPSGTAIKAGVPVVVEDCRTDPKYEAWRDEAKQLGVLSVVATPLTLNGDVLGVLTVLSDKKNAFNEEMVECLVEVAGDISVGVKTLRYEARLRRSAEDLQRMMDGTVKAMTSAIEMRDPYTAGHERRVAQLACAIAEEMGVPKYRIEGIRIAGYVHDIGKIAVPAEILAKPGKISDIEFGIIKGHPQCGYDVLKAIDFKWPVAIATLQHHERLDGSGYPGSLHAEEIILEARILAVADVVEAMSSHRPYRPALGIGKALDEIARNRGALYDADVADACARVFHDKGFVFEA